MIVRFEGSVPLFFQLFHLRLYPGLVETGNLGFVACMGINVEGAA